MLQKWTYWISTGLLALMYRAASAKKIADDVGFRILPRRWVVKRFFA